MNLIQGLRILTSGAPSILNQKSKTYVQANRLFVPLLTNWPVSPTYRSRRIRTSHQDSKFH
jgi:hypothetical protein